MPEPTTPAEVQAKLQEEIAARARAVEANAPNAADDGGQPPPVSEADQDAILARLADQHGLEDPDDSDPFQAPQGERSLLDDDRPLTWSKDQRDKGEDVVPRDAKGRFQAREAPAAAAPATAAPAPPSEQPARAETDRAQGEAPQYGQEELSTALRALRRDGYSDQDLQLLSDADVVRIGSRRAELQAQVDSRLAGRAREADHGERATLEPATTNGSAAPTAPARGPSADSAYDALEADAILAVGDATIGKQLAGSLRNYTESLLNAAHPGATDGGANGAMLEALLAERARDTVGERFPAVKKDDALWRTVASEGHAIYEGRLAQGIVTGGDPSSVLLDLNSAFIDAARIHAGAKSKSTDDYIEQRALRAARANGGMTRPTPQAPASAPQVKSQDDIDSMWLATREDPTLDERTKHQRLTQIEALRATVPPG